MPRSLLAACVAILACGCASLPPLDGRVDSRSISAAGDTPLAAAVAALSGPHPGKTGIHAMPLATDAFAARAVLAAAAQRSLDAQYYIWHDDQTGTLLFEALTQAARRGVRVRVLLDDQNTKGSESLLGAFAAEPGVELRLYNPFVHRNARVLDYLMDFGRLNRRMHNKAFIADGQVAVVGGRNIGNEYFGAGTEIPFKDLDVVAIGAAVADIAAQFDLYWNSASAYPAAGLLGAAGAGAAAELDARFAATRADTQSREYLEAVRATPLVASLVQRSLPLDWVDARLVRDDPAKTLDRAERADLLLSQLLDADAPARKSFDIISPYFVPGEKGTPVLARLARSGVRVRVLTNSYQATDVSVVHSGYAKRRCDLARAGVRLYEMKPNAGAAARGGASATGSGSSTARLHAKTFAADGERIFVGSFNFDPRSALLNTELGLVIGSTTLATRLSAVFDEWVPQSAYEVRPRDGDACVEWIERSESGQEVRHETEPGIGWLRRVWLGFLQLLPIDWML